MIELNCIRLGGSGGVANALSKDEVVAVLMENGPSYMIISELGESRTIFDNVNSECTFTSGSMYGSRIDIYIDGVKVAEKNIDDSSQVDFEYTGHEGSLYVNGQSVWRYEYWDGDAKPMSFIITSTMREIDYEVSYRYPKKYTIMPLLQRLIGSM